MIHCLHCHLLAKLVVFRQTVGVFVSVCVFEFLVNFKKLSLNRATTANIEYIKSPCMDPVTMSVQSAKNDKNFFLAKYMETLGKINCKNASTSH